MGENKFAAFLLFSVGFALLFTALMLLSLKFRIITVEFSPPKEKIIHVLPEKTDIPYVIYKVDDAFVIIINDKELSK